MILVIGGRSKIGSALIGELVASGESVRALVRQGENTGSLPDGVEAVTGDLAERNSLRAPLSGIDRLFLLCGPTEEEVQLNRNEIDVAKESDVKLLVRSSILGSDAGSQSTFVRDHGLCDEYLRGSGVPHVIVRPNLFLQNVPESTIPGIDARGNFYVNAADARVSMVDTRDVAAVAAKVLADPGHAGKAYDITGPEALSYGDVARVLSSTLNRQITYVDVPDDAVATALGGYGLTSWMVGALVGLYQEYRRSGIDGYAARVTATVRELTGREPRTLEQLLANQPAPAA
jgi:uncharacterized protein YbjT (DUF2867 family)